jgi:hypothetical protein
MRSIALAAVLTFVNGAAGAQTLRCESPDGKVAYAQNECPAGTQAVRALGAPGKPALDDQRAAAARARADAKALDRLERDARTEDARAAKAQRTDRVRAEARARSCKRLALRVKQAKDDADAVPLNRQSDAKRRLKKAQENYELECDPSQ